MAGFCANHPQVAASYRCEGCGELLCPNCVQEGTHLLFCLLCGERAVALETATRAAAGRQEGRTRPRPVVEDSYSWPEAVLYCLRGKGAYVFWSFVAALSLLDLVPVVGFALKLLILLALPGFLFLIARTTAKGDDELPDWPDFTDYGERLRELASFLLAALVAMVPTLILAFLGGCSWPLEVSRLGACVLLLILASWVSAALWVGSFGATGIYQDYRLALRVDHHVRALLAGGPESALVVFLVYLAYVGLSVFGQLFAAIPFFGFILANLLTVYGFLTGAHLIGVHFRRHAAAMDEIYGT